ncbi:MAG: PAS domain S-box protein [Ghiorsea sp.]|nr:PAS domain S-box protein [Ghiorsea sp.]
MIKQAHSDMWDVISRKKTKIFYYVFVPIVAVFSVLNFLSGFMVVSFMEAAVFFSALATILLQQKISELQFSHLSVAYISIAVFVFLFFPAVGNSAYLWAIGLPFFTSYLVGSRATLYWSLSFLLVAGVVGISLFYLEYSLYWPWELAPYIVLPYIVSTVFAVSFARYMERYIRDLKQAQEKSAQDAQALEESESRYKTLLQSSMNAVGVHQNGQWIYANPACVKLMGAEKLENMIGKPVIDFVHPAYRTMALERIEEMQNNKKPVPMVEERFVRLDGESFPAEVSAAPIVFDGEEAFMITVRDISELKQYEKEQKDMQYQLEHVQRLESLGVLTGGIAHDFNNLLTAIAGNAELLRSEVKDVEAAQLYMDHIDDSCNHAADLCKQMLAYAGKGQYEIDSIALNDLVDSISRLMRASVSSSIRLGIQLDENLPMIEGDASQVKQVILNFIVNSADAIGEQDGQIKISTFRRVLNRKKLGVLYNGTHMDEGEYVVLEVKDSGCGMSESLQKKIFDPFVTTKTTGSGLGLSAVLGIVKAHHGGLEVRSEENKGTVFRVFFPISGFTKTTSIAIGTGEIDTWGWCRFNSGGG